MTQRELQRYIDDLLAGRRPTPFRADEFEAEQIRTAIDLAAARPGADEPSAEFLQSLHDRLAAQSDDPTASVRQLPQRTGSTRRQVIVGTSAAAAAAVAAVAVDRAVIGRPAVTGRAHRCALDRQHAARPTTGPGSRWPPVRT